MLFIMEALHWTDPTTLEFLNLLIEQIPTTSILTVLTCRPHFQPSWQHYHLSHCHLLRQRQRPFDFPILMADGARPLAVMRNAVVVYL
jgi:hypothetical protein